MTSPDANRCGVVGLIGMRIDQGLVCPDRPFAAIDARKVLVSALLREEVIAAFLKRRAYGVVAWNISISRLKPVARMGRPSRSECV